MIKNYAIFQKFEDQLLRQTVSTIEERYAILEALYRHAVALGAFPPAEPLDGLEHDIYLAKTLNGIRSS